MGQKTSKWRRLFKSCTAPIMVEYTVFQVGDSHIQSTLVLGVHVEFHQRSRSRSSHGVSPSEYHWKDSPVSCSTVLLSQGSAIPQNGNQLPLSNAIGSSLRDRLNPEKWTTVIIALSVRHRGCATLCQERRCDPPNHHPV